MTPKDTASHRNGANVVFISSRFGLGLPASNEATGACTPPSTPKGRKPSLRIEQAKQDTVYTPPLSRIARDKV